MNTSVPDDGMDLCISMEAFLYVGPGNHETLLHEVQWFLRPGGPLIFTDILGKPERIGLQSFQMADGYFQVAKSMGFGKLSFEEHSSNVSVHYLTVSEALEEAWQKQEINIKESSKPHG